MDVLCEPQPDAETAGYYKVLRDVFGLEQFREKQLDAIKAIVKGHDTLVIFPTGAGKSLIYQLAAVYTRKTAVVISPLISLMDDQVTKLRCLGITAFTVNSSTSMNTKIQAFDRMRDHPSSISLLYVTPETFRLEEFLRLLKAMAKNNLVAFIAVDECHVLTDWGNTFRSSYRGLSSLRTNFPGIPIIALTATATRYTATDIVACLRLSSSFKMFIKSFNRENLYYKVICVRTNSSKISLLIEYLQGYKKHVASLASKSKRHKRQALGDSEYPNTLGAVIVYCYTRDETESVARRLVEEGFNAQYFHAKLSQTTKVQILTDWIQPDTPTEDGVSTNPDNMQIIVATIAFGMGIDRANVRVVIHYNIPRSMEGFYQESGRAGRDSKPAVSLVLLDSTDSSTAVSRIQRDGSEFELYSLHNFFSFCLQRKCRRKLLLAYFNSGVEKSLEDSSWCCDICSGRSHALTTVYSDMLDAVLGKLAYYTNKKGGEFLGCLRDLVDSDDQNRDDGTADIDSQLEPRLKRIESHARSCDLSDQTPRLSSTQDPSLALHTTTDKYKGLFRSHMQRVLLHLPSSTLERKLDEIHTAISDQANDDSTVIEACYKKIYTRIKAMTTYPTEDNVYSFIFSFFKLAYF